MWSAELRQPICSLAAQDSVSEGRSAVRIIQVLYPSHYWLAARADMPWLCDPDVVDGKQRWPDRGERDWVWLAEAVERLGRVIAQAEPVVDEDTGVEVVCIDVAALLGVSAHGCGR